MANLSILNWSPDSKSVVIAEGDPQRFEALDVSTGDRRPLAARSKYSIHDGVLSPDGKWFAFKMVISRAAGPIFVAPVTAGQAASESTWIKITGDEYHAKPFWSPGGDLLYYYSDRDTQLCLYARRLNTQTKQPQGDAFVVRHFHDDLRVDARQIGYGMAPDRLYLPLETERSNVWLAEPQEQPR